VAGIVTGATNIFMFSLFERTRRDAETSRRPERADQLRGGETLRRHGAGNGLFPLRPTPWIQKGLLSVIPKSSHTL
jgi:hypothetical protein